MSLFQVVWGSLLLIHVPVIASQIRTAQPEEGPYEVKETSCRARDGILSVRGRDDSKLEYRLAISLRNFGDSLEKIKKLDSGFVHEEKVEKESRDNLIYFVDRKRVTYSYQAARNGSRCQFVFTRGEGNSFELSGKCRFLLVDSATQPQYSLDFSIPAADPIHCTF